MTTKVAISLAQIHLPVVVEVLRSDGTISQVQVLRELGQVAQEYVHSGQTLRVREVTTQELHAAAPAEPSRGGMARESGNYQPPRDGR